MLIVQTGWWPTRPLGQILYLLTHPVDDIHGLQLALLRIDEGTFIVEGLNGPGHPIKPGLARGVVSLTRGVVTCKRAGRNRHHYGQGGPAKKPVVEPH